MSTFLFEDHVFGPIQSRRLGSSLGINLLSTKQKVCNFNCVYCECGLTHQLEKEDSVYVDTDFLLTTLRDRLIECKADTGVDSITFAGNGEPTMHKDFLPIVKEVCALRDAHFPYALVSALTNGYTLDQEKVKEALMLVDKAIIKMDAGSDDLVKLINKPKGRFPIKKLMKNLQDFEGRLIIQTMLLRGTVDGKIFDNSEGKDFYNWLDLIKKLKPSEVMLYSLDRDTPIDSLEKISKTDLELLAVKVRSLNIETTVV